MTHHRMIITDGYGVAYGPNTFDQFAVPKPDEVIFTLRGGKLADYQANNFGWRICSEPLMRLLDGEKAAGDGIDWIPVEVDAGGRRHRYFLFQAKPRAEFLHRTTITSPSGLPIKPVLDDALARQHRVFLLSQEGIAIIVADEVKQNRCLLRKGRRGSGHAGDCRVHGLSRPVGHLADPRETRRGAQKLSASVPATPQVSTLSALRRRPGWSRRKS